MPSGVYIRTKKNHWIGKKHSIISRKKMSLSHIGKSNARTHGMYGTTTYRTWASMKNRCLNKNYEKYRHYGGRGITICDRWMKFENFLEDMGVRPDNKTLDRVDVNGNYEKENCKWATQSEQMLNTRNHLLTKN